MYMGETGHISRNKPHSNSYYNGEIRVEKGKGKWKLYVYYILSPIKSIGDKMWTAGL